MLDELAVNVQDYVDERELPVQGAWWAQPAPLESHFIEAVEAAAPTGVGPFSESQAARGRCQATRSRLWSVVTCGGCGSGRTQSR